MQFDLLTLVPSIQRKFATKLKEVAEDAAGLETRAMGSAVMTQTMGYQVAAQLFDYYSGLCDKIHGETAYPNSQGKAA